MDWRAVTSTAISVGAVALQPYALLRSLRLEDDEEREYRRTVACFIGSTVVLLAGLLLALIDASLS